MKPDEYFASVPEFARPICDALRTTIRKVAPELREVMKWSSPCYEGRGLVFGLSAFKAHVRLFFFKGAQVPDVDGLFEHGEDNASARSLKFSSIEEVPLGKLEKLIRAAATFDAEGAAKPMPRARRPELPMPKVLVAALNRAPEAKAFFATLAPSCRREYIEWISAAKKEETQARRLEQTIEMLTAGRRRHEQYRAER
jgi:uncharacterized protein YdeI (YjbR/CyaY-like superfamily)